MTTHRSFKALVRARMAKTGERYSTARMHLVASLAPEGAAVAPPQGTYPTPWVEREHAAALHARALAASGVRDPDGEPWTEAALCGLGGGIGFMFATFDYGELVTTTIVTRYHPGPYHQQLRDRSGAVSATHETGSAARAARALDDAVDSGRPAICTVARGGLPWHDVDGLEGRDEHLVVVVGSEPSGDLVIDDRGDQLHTIDPETFADARSLAGSAKHLLVTVEPGDPVDLAAQVDAALADTIRLLASGEAPDGVPASWAKKFGILGMRTMADLMLDTRTKKGWPRLFTDGDRGAGHAALDDALARIQACLGGEYGGEGATRALYADFCAEMADRLDRPPLAEAADAYRRCADAWSAIADDAVRRDGEDAETVFARLGPQVHEVADVEETAVTHLTAATTNAA